MNILGIMSGTSLDGVDYVLCQEVKASKSKKSGMIKYLDKAHVPFSKKIKEQLVKAVANELDLWSTARLHYDLGAFYADGLKKILKKKKWKFHLIGLHGQTVFHDPQKCTLQIGEPSFLKNEFNVPVIAQFRNVNISSKGQGAPFAPFFHKALMQEFKQPWVFQNIGGMGNVSFISKNKLFAFDTGPGNVLIDEQMQILFKKEFDKDGALARKGIPDIAIIEGWLKGIGYFSQPIPKSCGRESFSSKALEDVLKTLRKLSPEDQIATLTEFTVLSLKDQYKRFIKPMPQLIVVSGGGAKNSRLMQRLAFHFPESEVVTSEDLLGWPVDAIEGGAFAWLALKRFREERILDLPNVTGSKIATQLGVIC